MENKIELSAEEIGLFELALSNSITLLYNRFKDEVGYVHPAKKYEDLYDKLTAYLNPLPACNYTLLADVVS